jgi:hypothetical protein
MALPGGHWFPVAMNEVFPAGFYALGVEQAMDYDERTGRRTASKDKLTGDLVWTVTGIDRDPDARDKQVKVKVSGPVMPVLPGELLPGSGLHEVEFTDLTVTPYVNEGRGRARLGLSLRAKGFHAPTRTATLTGPTGSGAVAGPGTGAGARRASGGDTKPA